jgi:hypothetical protein
MNMLYDSETFSVLHILANQADDADAEGNPVDAITGESLQLIRHGFEIVDKRTGKELYLDGSWAEYFQAQINAWQRTAPTQEEVETLLDSYACLAQTPVVVH